MKYEVKITNIGNLAETFLRNNSSLIILNQAIYPGLTDMVIEHTAADLYDEIKAGDMMTIGVNTYTIKAVGNDVVRSLREHGHCTILFNRELDLDGQISVEGESTPRLMRGDTLTIH